LRRLSLQLAITVGLALGLASFATANPITDENALKAKCKKKKQKLRPRPDHAATQVA
jgi:hypothetical protein